MIALVISIIVMLILAGVSLNAIIGENGVLNQATNARIMTAISKIKEELHFDYVNEYVGNNKISVEDLLAQGKVKRVVIENEGRYEITYAIVPGTFNGMDGIGNGNAVSGKDVFYIDEKLNLRYVDNQEKEYGDKLENKILDDETKIRFQSQEFSAYISKITGISESEMKFKWMKTQQKLTIDDSSIMSLEDLIFFPNLERLVLKNLRLDNLNGIEYLKNLTRLSLNNTIIDDFSQLANVETLESFEMDTPSTFDASVILPYLSQISNLTELSCVRVKLNSLGEIVNMKQLTNLALGTCRLEDISNIDNLENLTSLNLYGNPNITNVEDISKLTNLTYLNLGQCNINDILPLSNLTQLTELNLQGNSEIKSPRSSYTNAEKEKLDTISEINLRGKIVFDIDKISLFKNYTSINLSNSGLTSLSILKEIDGLEDIVSLTGGYGNNLTLEDDDSQNVLKKMTGLKTLELNYNPITNLNAINDLESLTTLRINNANINLKDIEDRISGMSLIINQDTFNTITNCSADKITSLTVRDSSLTSIPNLSKFTALNKIDLGGNSSIQDFSNISQVTSLTDLILDNCNLKEKMITFTQLTNLENLNLTSNFLASSDISNLSQLKNNDLKVVNLNNNSIIDASSLLELKPTTQIILTSNLNLSQESKDSLKARFNEKVKF